MVNMKWFPKIELKFKPQDMWVGVYWERKKWLDGRLDYDHMELFVYVCILPMLPIKLTWIWR